MISMILQMRLVQIQQENQVLMQAAPVAQKVPLFRPQICKKHLITILKMGLQMLFLNLEQEALKAHLILALVQEKMTKGTHQAQREE